jgi:hypothetical protein
LAHSIAASAIARARWIEMLRSAMTPWALAATGSATMARTAANALKTGMAFPTVLSLSMVFSENRFLLFGIML